MKNILRLAALASLVQVVLLAGCAVISSAEPAALYDLGPLRSAQTADLPAVPPVRIASIGAPAWLDNTSMYYRLNYANDQQPRPYAQARWTMSPAQLLQQELKSRIVHSGGVVLSASDSASDAPLLHIEVDDFTQNFSAPAQSNARVDLLASVFQGRKLVAQKSFSAQAPAPSADAPGGARALAAATDAAIADIIKWLAALNLK